MCMCKWSVTQASCSVLKSNILHFIYSNEMKEKWFSSLKKKPAVSTAHQDKPAFISEAFRCYIFIMNQKRPCSEEMAQKLIHYPKLLQRAMPLGTSNLIEQDRVIWIDKIQKKIGSQEFP